MAFMLAKLVAGYQERLLLVALMAIHNSRAMKEVKVETGIVAAQDYHWYCTIQIHS